MHVLACRKRGLKLVRGRAVGTGPQNGCRIASLSCHGQSLEEVHEELSSPVACLMRLPRSLRNSRVRVSVIILYNS